MIYKKDYKKNKYWRRKEGTYETKNKKSLCTIWCVPQIWTGAEALASVIAFFPFTCRAELAVEPNCKKRNPHKLFRWSDAKSLALPDSATARVYQGRLWIFITTTTSTNNQWLLTCNSSISSSQPGPKIPWLMLGNLVMYHRNKEIEHLCAVKRFFAHRLRTSAVYIVQRDYCCGLLEIVFYC